MTWLVASSSVALALWAFAWIGLRAAGITMPNITGAILWVAKAIGIVGAIAGAPVAAIWHNVSIERASVDTAKRWCAKQVGGCEVVECGRGNHDAYECEIRWFDDKMFNVDCRGAGCSFTSSQPGYR